MSQAPETEPCDWKVDFWTASGHRRTAYLEDITFDHLMAVGTEKHTDEPVALVREKIGDRWRESR